MTGKIKIAQGIDGNIGMKFQQYSKFGETISKSTEELLKMMPNQGNSDNSSNNELLQNIQKGNAELVQKIEALKTVVNNFGEQTSTMNFTQAVMNAKKSNVSLQQVFETYDPLMNFKGLVILIKLF